MIIRYECPKTHWPGSYALLNTETRMGTGYYPDGRVRWSTQYVDRSSEEYDVKWGIWVLPMSPADQLPEGF